MIFKCRHRFSDLVVYSDSTEKNNKEHPEEFKEVTHHLYCAKCGTKLDLKYLKIKGGVSEFIKR